jgi:hypothetical protein
VFVSRARNMTGTIGLEHVDFLSSEAGVPVVKLHDYELLTTYDNTSGTDQDSMAVMYTYLHDREYRRPDLTLNVPPTATAETSSTQAAPGDSAQTQDAPSRPTTMKMPPAMQAGQSSAHSGQPDAAK